MHGLSVKLPKWPIFCQNGHFGRLGLLTKSIFLLTDMMILWLLVWKLVQKIHWDQFLDTLLYYHHTQIRISEIPLYWGLYCKMPTFEPLIGSCWDSNHAELSRRRFQRRDRILATGFLKVSKYLSTSVARMTVAQEGTGSTKNKIYTVVLQKLCVSETKFCPIPSCPAVIWPGTKLHYTSKQTCQCACLPIQRASRLDHPVKN